MNLTTQDWHNRYTQQARWTSDLRGYLFKRIGITAKHILEVGCGTGAVLADIRTRLQHESKTPPKLHGLDIDGGSLIFAQEHLASPCTQGDASALPYPAGQFEITCCHFLLLWLADPVRALCEMARVTAPGGVILALAEPDYGGRIDYPAPLQTLGTWQMKSLRSQGADPEMGRKLAGLFHQAGLEKVETGVLGGQWTGSPDWPAWESEWTTIQSDYAQLDGETTPSTFEQLKARDRAAYEDGERVLFVPTFYALGWVIN